MIAELEKIKTVWPSVQNVLSVPRTKKHYNLLAKILDELTDEVGGNEKHPLLPLMETIGCLIEIYENENIPEPEGNSVDVIRHLMQEHGLTQKDLPEIGSQGVVSEVLNGRRTLNARQVRALAKRFHISPAAFI
ncbi:helix-turn-helix domain-containing protein [Leptonema illini]|uniref:Transcriptional regulator, XRE family n=1 Tax=Leptonema illini DSM 21528 TaxID=929563 RepID=H2CKF0_9LEPT|nr:helix-turn-helix domain-containing protein [Leptonema illini]EHQ08255.1 transcriptional regulator, XRE family [Leptonema illini DSM 21528]PKL33463.1 MAG: transcriptional regulator [Spirochaetae bacterium HGW-Spirochaetae-10]